MLKPYYAPPLVSLIQDKYPVAAICLHIHILSPYQLSPSWVFPLQLDSIPLLSYWDAQYSFVFEWQSREYST